LDGRDFYRDDVICANVITVMDRVITRLERLGQEVGLPIDRPNVMLTRVSRSRRQSWSAPKKVTTGSAFFNQDVSRAFFTKHADISKREIIVPTAKRFGIAASEVEAAWNEHSSGSHILQQKPRS